MSSEEDNNPEILVSLSVMCRNPYQLQKVAEVLGRAGTGLALEGIMVNMSMAQCSPDTEEVDG